MNNKIDWQLILVFLVLIAIIFTGGLFVGHNQRLLKPTPLTVAKTLYRVPITPIPITKTAPTPRLNQAFFDSLDVQRTTNISDYTKKTQPTTTSTPILCTPSIIDQEALDLWKQDLNLHIQVLNLQIKALTS